MWFMHWIMVTSSRIFSLALKQKANLWFTQLNKGEKLEVHFRLSYPRNRRRTLRSRMHGSVSTCFAALRLRHKADPNYEARDSKRTKEVNYSMRGADYAYMTIHFL